MSDNASQITGILESAMTNLRAAENDLSRAKVMAQRSATGSEAANLRNIGGTVIVAKKALITEIERWESSTVEPRV